MIAFAVYFLLPVVGNGLPLICLADLYSYIYLSYTNYNMHKLKKTACWRAASPYPGLSKVGGWTPVDPKNLEFRNAAVHAGGLVWRQMPNGQ